MHLGIASVRHRRSTLTPSRFIIGGLAVTGAALLAFGVTLPWLSFFAGLQPVNALGTLNGSLLLAGAAGAGLLGLVAFASGSTWARRGLAGLGIALTAFSAYLAVGLVTVYREASADPLMVTQLGPGLVLVGVGAVLVLLTAFVGEGAP